MRTTYAVFSVSALSDGEGWYENDVMLIGKFSTKAQNHSKAFHRYLNSRRIRLFKGYTYTEYNGDSYIIRLRKTDQPIYRATQILDEECFY